MKDLDWEKTYCGAVLDCMDAVYYMDWHIINQMVDGVCDDEITLDHLIRYAKDSKNCSLRLTEYLESLQ